MNRFFVPIAVIISAIVMTILYFCNLHFIYYLFGSLIAIITHVLMTIQNRSMYNTISTKYGRETFHPKKSSILWYVLRIVIALGLIAGIFFLGDIKNSPDKLQIVILFLSGYLTIKMLFIFFLIKFERR